MYFCNHIDFFHLKMQIYLYYQHQNGNRELNSAPEMQQQSMRVIYLRLEHGPESREVKW